MILEATAFAPAGVGNVGVGFVAYAQIILGFSAHVRAASIA